MNRSPARASAPVQQVPGAAIHEAGKQQAVEEEAYARFAADQMGSPGGQGSPGESAPPGGDAWRMALTNGTSRLITPTSVEREMVGAWRAPSPCVGAVSVIGA